MYINIELDQSNVYSMVDTFVQGIQDAELLAIREIERVIKNSVFDVFVRRLCERAGPGWVSVYTDQLIAQMKQIPVFTDTEGGIVTVSFDFESLGDYNDLEKSAHHRAIEGIADGQYGTTRGGKNRYNRHPPLVSLPYEGQELYNDGSYNDKRVEFWEEVIVEGDMSYELSMRKGNMPLTAADLEYVASFDEVTFTRVAVWKMLGKAPQWLWLENGFTDSKPVINPVDFTNSIEIVSECVAGEIYEGAMKALVRIAEEAGSAIAVGGSGRAFKAGGQGPTSGRFVKQRQILTEITNDYSSCFGRI